MPRNLAWWRTSAILSFLSLKISTFIKSKMAASASSKNRKVKNRKMTISQQRFDWSPRNLAWWRVLTVLTPSHPYISHIWISKMARPPSWKIEKSPNLSNGSTDRREIWPCDTDFHWRKCIWTILGKLDQVDSNYEPQWNHSLQY